MYLRLLRLFFLYILDIQPVSYVVLHKYYNILSYIVLFLFLPY